MSNEGKASPKHNGQAKPSEDAPSDRQEEAQMPTMDAGGGFSGNVKPDGRTESFRVKLVGPGPHDVIEEEILTGTLVRELLELLFIHVECLTRPRMGLYVDGQALPSLSDATSTLKKDQVNIIEVRPEPYSHLDMVHHLELCVSVMLPGVMNKSFTNVGRSGLLKFVAQLPNKMTLEDCVSHGVTTGKDVLASQWDELLRKPIFSKSPGEPPAQPISLEDIFQRHTVMPSVKHMSLSQWNPPKMSAAMQGDLMYLRVVTLEIHVLHITANRNGFYVNRSTDEECNTAPADEPSYSHSLNGCLKKASAAFFPAFERARRILLPDMRVQEKSLPLMKPPWAVMDVDSHQSIVSVLDFRRAGVAEAQTTAEIEISGLCQKGFEPQRGADPYVSEVQFYNVYMSFLLNAFSGSRLLEEGSLNEASQLSALWNGIVFTSSETDYEAFDAEGGEAAAFAAMRLDVQGQQLVWTAVRAGTDRSIGTLPTAPQVCIDLKGHRFVAQSLIPGMLDRDLTSNFSEWVEHGYSDVNDCKRLAWSQQSHEKLQPYHIALLSKPHNIIGEDGEPKTFNFSTMIKSMRGSDGRLYFFDFSRMLPVDANFVDISGKGKLNGKPLPNMPHKMFFLRPELAKEFVEYRLWAFMMLVRKMAREELLKDTSESQDSSENGTSSQERDAAVAETSRECIEVATAMVSSMMEALDLGQHVTAPKSMSIGDLETELKRMTEGELGASLSDQQAQLSSRQVRTSGEKTTDVGSNTSADQEGASDRQPNASKQTAEQKDEKANQGEVVVNGDIDGNGLSAAPSSKPEGEATTSEGTDGQQRKPVSPAVQELVKRAAARVGSYTQDSCRIGFNLDIGNPRVKPADDEETLQRDCEVVEAASIFLVNSVILRLMIDVCHLRFNAIDTTSIRTFLHSGGVNMRYLGNLAACAAERPELWFIKKVCVSEIILRSTKHIMRPYLRKVPRTACAQATSHFLNCFLSNSKNMKPPKAPALFAHMQSHRPKRKQKKSQKQAVPVEATGDTSWQELTAEKLWHDIVEEAQSYYRFQLDCKSCVEACQAYNLQPVSLLRGICIMMGIQVQARNYNFNSPYEPTFVVADILNLFPIMKFPWVEPRGVDEKFKLIAAIPDLAFKKVLLCEILHIYNGTVGGVSLNLAKVYSVLSAICAEEGSLVDAVLHLEEATYILEYACGIDHPLTITSYLDLSDLLVAAGQLTLALQITLYARSLLLLMFGPDHPDQISIDIRIGECLLNKREPELALQFLQHCTTLFQRYEGINRENDLYQARIQHKVAQCYLLLGDYRTSLKYERMVYSTYRTEFGEQHFITLQCAALLSAITQKAVQTQKVLQQSMGALSLSPAEEKERQELLSKFSALASQQHRRQQEASLQEEEGDGCQMTPAAATKPVSSSKNKKKNRKSKAKSLS